MNLRVAKLADFPSGWFIGNFVPTFSRQADFEICLKSFSAGDLEPEHFQEKVTEFSLVVFGNCRLGNVVLSAGEIVEVPAGISLSFEALSDCTLLVVKTPSVPGDKILGKGKTSLG